MKALISRSFSVMFERKAAVSPAEEISPDPRSSESSFTLMFVS